MPPPRSHKPTKTVSLWQTVNWIGFDDFGPPTRPDSEDPLLKAAKWNLFEALRDGYIVARGTQVGLDGCAYEIKNIPPNFWKFRHVFWSENLAEHSLAAYASITLSRKDVEGLWPPQPVISITGAKGAHLDNTKLKSATEAKIHDTITKAYDAAQKEKKKPPNVKELPKIVIAALKAEGFGASSNLIQRLADAPQHAARRRKPGKTLASEKSRNPK